MALHGTWSGKLDIKSPAARFFKSFTDDIIYPTEGIAEEVFESIESEKRTVTIKMSDRLISEKYKSVKATITVTPREDGDGSQVVWTIECSKISSDIDDPQFIIDTLVNFLKETDENLLP
ncbi:PREDICTED: uncharacterized protein At1g24000-like [Camelina sativa]|uniref:Uncharacterized protein At1g24000-like n=1 Tax=Camelina sativa TaxID=90675 RepID=A0ABM0YCF1_CAMSA|nr:PREDICTED: uncharacterized protein At1g24000-like [Camelina sativa]XP_010498916.1 PREDICTED: uncharacterized protein At1g24000-like [Camelina sativa]